MITSCTSAMLIGARGPEGDAHQRAIFVQHNGARRVIACIPSLPEAPASATPGGLLTHVRGACERSGYTADQVPSVVVTIGEGGVPHTELAMSRIRLDVQGRFQVTLTLLEGALREFMDATTPALVAGAEEVLAPHQRMVIDAMDCAMEVAKGTWPDVRAVVEAEERALDDEPEPEIIGWYVAMGIPRRGGPVLVGPPRPLLVRADLERAHQEVVQRLVQTGVVAEVRDVVGFVFRPQPDLGELQGRLEAGGVLADHPDIVVVVPSVPMPPPAEA